jgi:hypothetical protein
MILLNRRKNFLQTAAPQASLLLEEQFEGPGATGWTSSQGGNYSAWLSTYTPALLGDYSALMSATGSTGINAYKNFTPSGSVYCRFRIRHRVRCAINSSFITFQTSTGTTVATFQLQTGTSRPRIIVLGGTLTAATETPLLDTDYFGWFEYQKGTGGPTASCRAGFSIEPIRPTSWTGLNAQSLNGTTTLDAGRILFGSSTAATNYDVVIDDIQVQSTPFA